MPSSQEDSKKSRYQVADALFEVLIHLRRVILPVSAVIPFSAAGSTVETVTGHVNHMTYIRKFKCSQVGIRR